MGGLANQSFSMLEKPMATIFCRGYRLSVWPIAASAFFVLYTQYPVDEILLDSSLHFRVP